VKEHVIVLPIDENRTHYHFKKRKDMELAMRSNFNAYDTFSYAGKAWGGIVPTKEQLREWG
jgi:hypothetical protein